MSGPKRRQAQCVGRWRLLWNMTGRRVRDVFAIIMARAVVEISARAAGPAGLAGLAGVRVS